MQLTSTRSDTSAVSIPEEYRWSADKLAKYNTVIFDCDGVLWSSGKAVAGAKDTLQKLQAMGKRVLFLSNNSSKLIEKYVENIERLFELKVDVSQVWTSAIATVSYLKSLPEFAHVIGSVIGTAEDSPKKDVLGTECDSVVVSKKPSSRVFLIGSPAMNTMLRRAGFDVIWSSDLKRAVGDRMHPGDLPLDSSVCAVVVCSDKKYGFFDVTMACRYLREAHSSESPSPVYFVASNDDSRFPFKPGVLTPGTGSLLAAIKEASRKLPIVCGKPHSILMDCIQRQFADVRADSTLMVGDRLHSDIAFAKRIAIDSVLVFSGVTAAVEAESLIQETGIKPTFIMESIAGMALVSSLL